MKTLVEMKKVDFSPAGIIIQLEVENTKFTLPLSFGFLVLSLRQLFRMRQLDERQKFLINAASKSLQLPVSR